MVNQHGVPAVAKRSERRLRNPLELRFAHSRAHAPSDVAGLRAVRVVRDDVADSRVGVVEIIAASLGIGIVCDHIPVGELAQNQPARLLARKGGPCLEGRVAADCEVMVASHHVCAKPCVNNGFNKRFPELFAVAAQFLAAGRLSVRDVCVGDVTAANGLVERHLFSQFGDYGACMSGVSGKMRIRHEPEPVRACLGECVDSLHHPL